MQRKKTEQTVSGDSTDSIAMAGGFISWKPGQQINASQSDIWESRAHNHALLPSLLRAAPSDAQ